MRLGKVIAAGAVVTYVAGLCGASVTEAYGLGGVTMLIASGIFLSQRGRTDEELALFATMWLIIGVLALERLLIPDAVEGMSFVASTATAACAIAVAYLASLTVVRRSRRQSGER